MKINYNKFQQKSFYNQELKRCYSLKTIWIKRNLIKKNWCNKNYKSISEEDQCHIIELEYQAESDNKQKMDRLSNLKK